MNHIPLDDCFCESLDQHTVIDGFNLFCSDIETKYYLTVNSSKAYNFLKKVKTESPTKKDDKKFIERKNDILKNVKTKIDFSDLPNILDIEFESQIWKDLAKRCLNCGTCAMVCPTCYCCGVEESITTNLRTGTKTRVQYSCNLVAFALIAGGLGLAPVNHNPYMNNIVQLIEVYHVMLESIDMIDTLLDSDAKELQTNYAVKQGRGVGAVEVPRGILYHEYEPDKTGRIVKAHCVIPTTQNNANIHYDLAELVLQQEKDDA